MSGLMIEKVDLSLLSARDIKRTGSSQKERPYDERFVQWLMMQRGRKREDAVWEAYKLAKVQRETRLGIMTKEEADDAAAFILTSSYAKSTKRLKLFAIKGLSESESLFLSKVVY